MSVARAVAATAIALLLSTPLQAATVYKWTNDQGVVQYTDSPPEGRKYQRLEVGGSGSRAAPEPAREEATAGADAPKTPAQQRLDGMKRACDMARANLEKLEQYETVQMDLDGDGTPELLDAAARATQIERNRRQAEQYCLDTAGSAAQDG